MERDSCFACPLYPKCMADRAGGVPLGRLLGPHTLSSQLWSWLQRPQHPPGPSHCTKDEVPGGGGTPGHRALEGVCRLLALEHSVAGVKAERSAPSQAFQPHPESGRRGCCPQVKDIRRTFPCPPLSPWCWAPRHSVPGSLYQQGMCSPLGVLARMRAELVEVT